MYAGTKLEQVVWLTNSSAFRERFKAQGKLSRRFCWELGLVLGVLSILIMPRRKSFNVESAIKTKKKHKYPRVEEHIFLRMRVRIEFIMLESVNNK